MAKAIIQAFIIVSIFATIAFSQIDPDPNGMGLYLDEEATDICLSQLQAGYNEIDIYLIATNSTADMITGWECRLEHNTSATYDYGWIPTTGTNIALVPEYVVMFADNPIISDSPIIILATRRIIFIGLEEWAYADFWISPRHDGGEVFFGLGYYDGAGIPIPCVMPFSFYGRSGVFTPPSDPDILHACEHYPHTPFIGNESRSWGQVKALY